MYKQYLLTGLLSLISFAPLAKAQTTETEPAIHKLAISWYPPMDKVGLFLRLGIKTSLEARFGFDYLIYTVLNAKTDLRLIYELEQASFGSLYLGAGSSVDAYAGEGAQVYARLDLPVGVELFPIKEADRFALLAEANTNVLLTGNSSNFFGLEVIFGIRYYL